MSFVENLKYKELDFEIDIPRWEILDQGVTVLWGNSGAGKTTVLRLLIGLEPCSGMRWMSQGEDLAQLSVPDRRLGVVFQNLELFPHLSAWGNIHFAAQARKIPAATFERKLQRWSEILQMNSFLHRPAHQLSGGEKQRVALVRALVGNPRLLILDEPFSSLDENLREDSRQLLKKVLNEENIPALLVTHDRQDVESLATKISILKQGRLEETTSIKV